MQESRGIYRQVCEWRGGCQQKGHGHQPHPAGPALASNTKGMGLCISVGPLAPTFKESGACFTYYSRELNICDYNSFLEEDNEMSLVTPVF